MIDPLTRYLHRDSGQHGPVMLMYHSVTPGRATPAWPWAVSLRSFEQQLDFLASEAYATPTMAELIAAPERFHGRTAVITFDDGYVDNLAAFDALQQRSMQASWFIVAGSIGREPDWPGDGRPGERLLNAAELRAMQAAGMEIGSHTVRHARLTELDDTLLARELRDSKVLLEDAIGTPVTSFAYPYGLWDTRVADAVKQAGYIAACTTRSGWTLRDGDPYTLRRLTVFNADSASGLARKLYLGDNNASWRNVWRYIGGRLAQRIGLL